LKKVDPRFGSTLVIKIKQKNPQKALLRAFQYEIGRTEFY